LWTRPKQGHVVAVAAVGVVVAAAVVVVAAAAVTAAGVVDAVESEQN
jgi:hypothetical protein